LLATPNTINVLPAMPKKSIYLPPAFEIKICGLAGR
jgi:hypothetical protein